VDLNPGSDTGTATSVDGAPQFGETVSVHQREQRETNRRPTCERRRVEAMICTVSTITRVWPCGKEGSEHAANGIFEYEIWGSVTASPVVVDLSRNEAKAPGQLLSVSRPRRLGGQKRVMATAPHEVRQALENHYAPIEEFADAVVAHAAISSNPSHRLNFTDLARSLTSEPPVD
jgi:hypothetical protein